MSEEKTTEAPKVEPEVQPAEEKMPEGFVPLVGFDDEEDEQTGEPEKGGETPTPEKEPTVEKEETGKPSEGEEEKGDFKFEVDDLKPKEQTTPQPKDEELTEIVHNGQVFRLTKQELVNMAQKGFDYNRKMGPHQKLVQLIEADPGVSKVVDDYIQGKFKQEGEPQFKPLPLTDYDSEEEWLKANLVKAMGEMAPATKPVDTQPANVSNPADVIAEALFNRDTEHFHEVAPLLDNYAKKYLTVAEYNHINDPRNRKDLFRFYDKVKEHLLSQRSSQPPTPRKEGERPRFSAKPGGGEAPRKPDKTNVAWELPNDEFQKVLAKARGF